MSAIVILSLVSLIWLLLTEFSYLGFRRVQSVYAWSAPHYEAKWHKRVYTCSQVTHDLFVLPLEQALANRENPRVLDLACGTGRMSLLILNRPWFHGRIEAVDGSPLMLEQFRQRMAIGPPEWAERVLLKTTDLSTWSADGASEIDAVIFTEAGELVPGFQRLVAEVARSLRPGGLFLLTKPPDWFAWLFFGRCQTSGSLRRLLERQGFANFRVAGWRWRYSVVYATKASSMPAATPG